MSTYCACVASAARFSRVQGLRAVMTDIKSVADKKGSWKVQSDRQE